MTEGSKVQNVRWELVNDRTLTLIPVNFVLSRNLEFDCSFETTLSGSVLHLVERKSKMAENYRRTYDQKPSDFVGLWKSSSEIAIEIKSTNVPNKFEVVLKFEDGDSEYDATLVGNKLDCKIIEEPTGLKGQYKTIFEAYKKQFSIVPIGKNKITGYMGDEFKKD